MLPAPSLSFYLEDIHFNLAAGGANRLMLGSRTAVLSGGRIIAEGVAKDVITDESMHELYGIEVHVQTVGKRIICIPGPLE